LTALARSVASASARYLHTPEYAASTGPEAIDLCRLAGLELDEWQQEVITAMLGEREEDGKWSAFEAGLCVPRQNGKGAVLEARELAGLFLLGERLIIHSAHEFPTAVEAFERMLALIDSSEDLSRRVKRVARSHGEEGITLRTGQRLLYKTRTTKAGRGFTADCLILDEAMHLPEAMHGALFPTLSARPNPQVIYAGSAVDQESMEHGVVFARVRERGIEGKDPRLVYAEWSAPFDHPDEIPDPASRDSETWAKANPAFGIRISEEHVGAERNAMHSRKFAVERLNVGDWPKLTDEGSVIDVKLFMSLRDPASEPTDPVVFAFDVAEDRQSASITVGGVRDDGLGHVETVEHKRGTDWVIPRMLELAEKWYCDAILYSQTGPAAGLAAPLANSDVGNLMRAVNESEHAQACGYLFDQVEQRTFRHLGTAELTNALKGAERKPMGDSWAWSRKNSAADITPLVGVTLALWGVEALRQAPPLIEVFN
jgi:hypothetical protein